jgi:hypothetical protein
MKTKTVTGHCPVESNDEAVDFLLRLAKALGRSLAQEDNEQDMACSDGTSVKKDGLR